MRNKNLRRQCLKGRDLNKKNVYVHSLGDPVKRIKVKDKSIDVFICETCKAIVLKDVV